MEPINGLSVAGRAADPRSRRPSALAHSTSPGPLRGSGYAQGVIAALAAGLAACTVTPVNKAAIHVTVEVRAPIDCVRLYASDENKGPLRFTDLQVTGSAAESHTFNFAIFRDPAWGKNAQLYPEGIKGGCDGQVVVRADPQVAAFGPVGKVPNLYFLLEASDGDSDGYAPTLADGTPFDCNDAEPTIHPGAPESCDAGVDLDCDNARGCARSDCVGQTNSDGVRCCPGGTLGISEQNCHDGLDDDCDGKTDCGDEDCRGQVCDAFGRRCTGPGACTCANNDAGVQFELNCVDGVDDDCDGLVDCADPDCANKSCGGAQNRCLGGACCVVKPDGGVQAGPELCGDGVDNDCNGLTDCADQACVGKPSGATKFCCPLPGGGGVAVDRTETDCANGKDDDCDGLTDCEDGDCNQRACAIDAGVPGVCSGLLCRTENCQNRLDDNGDGKIDCFDPLCTGKACDGFGRLCAADGGCLCGGKANPVENGPAECTNGKDDDCDGLIDCADPSCAGQACGTQKSCQNGACACVLTEPSESSCANGADDDCDGKIDCADSDCAGKACNPSGGACVNGTCTCISGAETDCSNGVDDNCDGKADCADPTCLSKPCGGAGLSRQCLASGVCGCPTGAVESCANGVDDDCDGLIDCAQTATCTNGTPCGIGGKVCNGGVCSCPLGEVAEASCGDGLDNDCDGKIDCADSDCAGLACNPGDGGVGDRCAAGACTCPGGAAEVCDTPGDENCNGLADCADPGCAAGVSCGPNGKRCSANKICLCPSGQTRELLCGNGADDDCDGLIDCADPDCLGAACGPSQFCCGTGCASASAQGNCGYCSLTCTATTQSCTTTAAGAPGCTCASDNDCASPLRCKTSASTPYCVECLTSSDCPAARPTCAPNSNVCFCPPADAGCVPTCQSDGGGCGGATPVCDVAMQRCVGCLDSSQCTAGLTCVNFRCQ